MTASWQQGLIVGTGDGVWTDAGQGLAGQSIRSLATDRGDVWALTGAGAVWRQAGQQGGGEWVPAGSVDEDATCLVPLPGGRVLVGTKAAHLVDLSDGMTSPVKTFEEVEGRERWHTPWNAPADARSMASSRDGTVFVAVHVGGIVRSNDGGDTWKATAFDIDDDVHDIVIDDEAGTALAACAVGLAVSGDGGDTWTIERDGLEVSYLRAVAVTGERILVTASDGPRADEGLVYWRPRAGGRFRRCEGLPVFAGNVDTGLLAGSGRRAAVAGPGDSGGQEPSATKNLWTSDDGGATWDRAETPMARSGPAGIECVALAG